MFIFDLKGLQDLLMFMIILIFIAISYSIISLKDWIYNKKFKNKMRINKEIAINILDKFEEFLEENNIVIPSEDCEGNEDEACIYGTKYYDLEDSIIDILNTKK